ncbi:MAG: serine hydrolase [Nakamurella sp.]
MPTAPISANSPPVARRTLLRGLGLAGAAAAVTGLTSCTNTSAAQTEVPTPASIAAASGSSSAAATTAASSSSAASSSAASSSGATPADSPVGSASSGEITASGVDRALVALPDIIARNMTKTKVPGLAIAVVYDGKVRYLEGFGIRHIGRPAVVTADTVFYLASVSKPISSTVVAAAFTKKLAKVGWDDPIQAALPRFDLSDQWVGKRVTAADMFAHRSGLPDHAGDLLEDLGYKGPEIIAKLAKFPLGRFRDNYEYTNYGLTAGAEALAASAGRPWAQLSKQMVFGPLGMTSSSFTMADLMARPNRAAMHHKVNGRWTSNIWANYDGQAPAGGASSSVRDLSKWLSMLLADGKSVTDTEQLQRIWQPSSVKPGLPEIGYPASFYGLGWNVNYESTGELRLSHSGAFGRGAATAITVIPSKKLAIVVLTNGIPLGVPEAITVEFTDIARYGKSTEDDWLAKIGPYFEEAVTADEKKYSVPAVKPAAARPLSAYVGSYANSFYGNLTVSARDGGLVFKVGPAVQSFPLRHHSGNDFYFATTGENASGLSGAPFVGSSTRITSVTINAWNKDKLGTFVRA